MTLRRASAADAETLADLNTHLQAWHAARYPDTFLAAPDRMGLVEWFADRLSDPACTGFLSGDPPVGYVLCSLQIRDANVFSPPVRRLMVDHISVAPETRRQGHGRRLLEAARGLARDLGVDEILLDTWVDNTEAQAFFRAGVRRAGREHLRPEAHAVSRTPVNFGAGLANTGCEPYFRGNRRRTSCLRVWAVSVALATWPR